MVFCARDFSLTVRAFWRAEQLRWVETNFEEMREVDQCSDKMKTVEKNLLWWHVRRDGMRWEELRWGEKSSRGLRWDEVPSASVKCEVQGVKRALWSVRKVFAWRCIVPGSCAGHVLGQHLCNSLAQSTHARAWLAHGACKFYRWKRCYSYSYSVSRRQLPPRLVRALLVHFTFILPYFSSNFHSCLGPQGRYSPPDAPRDLAPGAANWQWMDAPLRVEVSGGESSRNWGVNHQHPPTIGIQWWWGLLGFRGIYDGYLLVIP